jgi:hypothetical protein
VFLACTAITDHLLAFPCSASGEEISPASMVKYPTAHIGRGDGNRKMAEGRGQSGSLTRACCHSSPADTTVNATSHVSSDPKQQRRIVALGDARPDQLMPHQSLCARPAYFALSNSLVSVGS